MKDLGAILQLSKKFVRSNPHGRPNHEVEQLIAGLMGFSSRLDLYTHLDTLVEEEELSFLRPAIQRLAKGEPLAYIVEASSFYGRSFYVTQDVLIPRPETELLVEKALGWLNHNYPQSLMMPKKIRCLDLCAGSGCIGITLQKERLDIAIDFIDISERALDIVKKNCQKHAVHGGLFLSDLFSSIESDMLYDLIVCNPPYLATEEMQALDYSIQKHEPRLALHAGPLGTELYQKIAESLPCRLFPGGAFFCEIGYRQKIGVEKILKIDGFSSPKTVQDYSGHDRIMWIEYSKTHH